MNQLNAARPRVVPRSRSKRHTIGLTLGLPTISQAEPFFKSIPNYTFLLF
jgi:hypothetical protein